MAIYATSYTGPYDASLAQFEVDSDPLPGFVTYELDDGTYTVGESISVTQLVFGSESQVLSGTLIGYSDIGFVIGFEDPESYQFITTETDLPFGAEILLTTSEPYVVCFLAGTMIATPGGEVAIETLKVGDLVLTVGGTAQPIRWLARQTVSTVFADPVRVLPILVRAGALGDNLPRRDLFVSPDHALEIDGVLVQAGALVNGTTITRHAEMPRTFVYYHVELGDHALLLAEGVPAETFVDNVTRRRFDNYAEFEALYGSGSPVAELDLPRVKSARQLPASIRARVEAGARPFIGTAA